MKRVYVALGGNIGDTEQVFRYALEAIHAQEGIVNLEVSSFHVTKPVSPIPQRDYLNAVCSFDTALEPKELFGVLQEIERQMGKVPKIKEAPRIIDLDILFYGDEKFQDEELTIPHPYWAEREFVLQPLNELLENQKHA